MNCLDLIPKEFLALERRWIRHGCGTIREILEETENPVQMEELTRISEEVRGAAYRIIEAKQATYYGIGMAMTRITKAILGDESSVLTVSAMLRGEYGQNGVFTGVPCIINQDGVQRVLTLKLSQEEQSQMTSSCDLLRDSFHGLENL